MLFILDGHEVSITTMEDLRQQLELVRQEQFSEIWLSAGDEGAVIAMLVNGVQAFLMYLQHSGDSGFSSRNPRYTGLAWETKEFILSNGQMDTYPVAWTLPLEESFAVCEYFFLSQGGRYPAIMWHDDSQISLS